MKGFFACLLAMFMITAMTALGETVVEDSVAHSFECQGFESSEAAMAAYLEAMKAGDVQGMLATFAIETWVDAGDPRRHFWKAGGHSSRIMWMAWACLLAIPMCVRLR